MEKELDVLNHWPVSIFLFDMDKPTAQSSGFLIVGNAHWQQALKFKYYII